MRQAIGLCVKCGLCLAECPTYGLWRDEGRSPRGRIALVAALASGELEAGKGASGLLSECLLCRRCERVCPSGVAFGRIMDEGRRLARVRLPWKARLATAALSRPLVARRLPGLARFAGRLLPPNALAARLGRRAGRAPAFGIHSPRGRVRGRVGLFLGCTAGLLESEALEGAVRLLTRAGYEVHVPKGQGCCGALERHAGWPRKAEMRLSALREGFGGGLDAVVGVSSGCGLHLAEQGRMGYMDIARFLVEQGGLARLRFRNLDARAALHLPCTLENGMQGSEAVRRLLGAVPGLEVVEIGRAGGCCGAGGLAFLAHPEQSRRIGAPLAAEIRRLTPRYVVTANAGCGLHLEGGAPGPEYLHPVALLARLLE